MTTRLWTPATLALAFVSILAAPAARAADVFDLDQSHFSIVFSVSHMNMSYTYGMFRQANGRVTLDRENPAATQFQLTINADSIDTNNQGRDTHLKGPDFFDVATFPTITFQSTTVVPDTSTPHRIIFQVTGNLTMHGQTRQITMPIEMLGEGPGPDGKPHAGFVMQTELTRSDFGIGGGRFADPNVVGNAISVTVSFEGISQGAAGAAAPPAR
jgi:polyisoprenoid-binding protein YceI